MDKNKTLEKVSFGITMMYSIYWIYVLFIKKFLNINDTYKNIIGLIVLYGIGLFIFKKIINKLPDTKKYNKKVKNKTIIICCLLQLTAFLISMLLKMPSIINNQELAPSINSLTPYMLFMLLIFNPIIEEFVFRKLFADKLLKHGELFYMISSSFCFALVHGFALEFSEVIYTFILGMIWSYLVVKTGSIKISIIIHSLSNLFGSVFFQLLSKISPFTLGIYFITISVLEIIGLIILFKNKKKIKIDNKNKLFDKTIFKEIITNKGIIVYILFTIIFVVLRKLYNNLYIKLTLLLICGNINAVK